MDFDRALKPPPQPTEEFTASLEDLIKRRIADQQFDDPVRKQAPPDVLQKQLAELDDKQPTKVCLLSTLFPDSNWMFFRSVFPQFFCQPCMKLSTWDTHLNHRLNFLLWEGTEESC